MSEPVCNCFLWLQYKWTRLDLLEQNKDTLGSKGGKYLQTLLELTGHTEEKNVLHVMFEPVSNYSFKL